MENITTRLVKNEIYHICNKNASKEKLVQSITSDFIILNNTNLYYIPISDNSGLYYNCVSVDKVTTCVQYLENYSEYLDIRKICKGIVVINPIINGIKLKHDTTIAQLHYIDTITLR